MHHWYLLFLHKTGICITIRTIEPLNVDLHDLRQTCMEPLQSYESLQLVSLLGGVGSGQLRKVIIYNSLQWRSRELQLLLADILIGGLVPRLSPPPPPHLP